MAAVLAAADSLVLLGRRGEVTALRASGVSFRRIAAPYLACGLLVSLGAGLVQELVAPPASALAREVREVRIRRRPADSLLRAMIRGISPCAAVCDCEVTGSDFRPRVNTIDDPPVGT